MHYLPATSRQSWQFFAQPDGLSALSVAAVLLFPAPCDHAALREALQALVARHEALRTTLAYRGRAVVQRIADTHPLPLEKIDVPPSSAPGDELQATVLAEMARPFNLLTGPLIRAGAVDLPTSRTAVVLTSHHAICDAWSIDIIRRDLAELHSARVAGRAPELPDLPLQFADYAAWENSAASAPPDDRWPTRLHAGVRRLPSLDVAASSETPAVFASCLLPPLSATLAKRLEELATAHRTTPPRALTAGVAASLPPDYCCRTTFGIWLANRRHELAPVVGDFADILPVSVHVGDDPSFVDLLQRVHRSVSEGLDMWAPFAALIPLLRQGPGRETGPPLDFTVNYRPNAVPGTDLAASGIEAVEPDVTQRRFHLSRWWNGLAPMDFQYRPRSDGGIGGHLLYNSSLIPPAAAASYALAAHEAIESACENPDRPISQLRPA